MLLLEVIENDLRHSILRDLFSLLNAKQIGMKSANRTRVAVHDKESGEHPASTSAETS